MEHINKIVNEKSNDIYVFFAREWCGYSNDCEELLKKRKLRYNRFNMKDLDCDKKELLKILNNHKELIKYDTEHTTFPIIFFHGEFVGGYSDLEKLL